MTEAIASCLDSLTASAPVWGFVLIFVFMAVESSFIPFPSEVVMIPAGFLAYRSGLTTGIPWLDLLLAIICGLAGSMAGAYVNYYLATHPDSIFRKKLMVNLPAHDGRRSIYLEDGVYVFRVDGRQEEYIQTDNIARLKEILEENFNIIW